MWTHGSVSREGIVGAATMMMHRVGRDNNDTEHACGSGDT